MTTIHAKRLTTFSIAADGASVAIGVADEQGQEGVLVLPAESLRALMMTLPEMMRRALRMQHGDPSLRLVYPLGHWEIERSTQSGTFIVSLGTSDGFQVSFAMTANDLHEMGEAASHRVVH